MNNKMTTVQVYLWILLGQTLEPFLSSFMVAARYNVEVFEPMEYNVELFAQSILENEFQDIVIKLHKVAVGKASVKKVCLQLFTAPNKNPTLATTKF